MRNPLDLLKKIWPKPATVPISSLDVDKCRLSDDEKKLLARIGLRVSDLSESVFKNSLINYERRQFYQEIDRACQHWMVGAACELYADYVSTYSPIHNATVWITSENSTYETELNKLLDRIGIEERIFDWAYTTGSYGDLFVEMDGHPSLGVASIEDSEHPIHKSRVDVKGRLIGFFDTPLGQADATTKLHPPWKYVHFRLVGVKKKRPLYGDPVFSEYRTINLLSPDVKRISSQYGTSLLINAIGPWKRLRLAEDSLLLARLTKGILKYIYKVKVDGTNIEAVDAIINQYTDILKRARALDTRGSSTYFDSKFDPISSVEDLIIPVWENVNDLAVEEIGGKADIKWIVDVEDLRNQLASSLRTPLSLMGGFVEEATGALGSQAIEKLDIRFARNARRLQRSLIEGITRTCQIHLAYMGMSPDVRLFEVNMPETSTAEEEALKESLERGVDIVDRFMTVIDTHAEGVLDKLDLLDYMNRKILKLSDLDFRRATYESKIKKIVEKFIADARGKEGLTESQLHTVRRQWDKILESKHPVGLQAIKNSDLLSFTPLENSMAEWKGLYENCKIEVKGEKEESKK